MEDGRNRAGRPATQQPDSRPDTPGALPADPGQFLPDAAADQGTGGIIEAIQPVLRELSVRADLDGPRLAPDPEPSPPLHPDQPSRAAPPQPSSRGEATSFAGDPATGPVSGGFPLRTAARPASRESAGESPAAGNHPDPGRPTLPSRFSLPAAGTSAPEPDAGSAPAGSPGTPPQAGSFRLAEQPAIGEHFPQPPPCVDPRAGRVAPELSDFSSPCLPEDTFDPAAQLNIYGGKPCQPTQRPAIEWFRPWYGNGPITASRSWFGFHNPDQFQFILAGDHRVAYADNHQRGDSQSLIASQLNLDFDLRLTSTERFHWFITPLTQGGKSTRWLLDDDRVVSELNADLLFGYFEGDLGAMMGGWTRKTLPFDLPFAVGVMPLVIQNGVWMEDAILGTALTIPAQNLPALGISNMDLTFLWGFDKLDSPAFEGDDNAAKIYALMAFIEAWNGYVEADYAFLEDRDTVRDRSYHNASIGYSRRYGLVSNSTRVIVNAGQSTDGGPNTADGVLLLSENSLVTALPYTTVPYLNLFAGFDRPQSAARQAAAGGVLRNTGILFETDNLTGYPTLDATANQTFGFAAGLNLIQPDFSQQLIVEAAWLGTMGDDAGRNARGSQSGVGARYQRPLSNSLILRMDAMYGFLESDQDVHGARIELRKKF